MRIVNENINDILKPKDFEEIQKELNKFSTEDKKQAVKSYLARETLITELLDNGADESKLIEIFVNLLSIGQLKEIVLDLLPNEHYVSAYIIDYSTHNQLYQIINTYFSEEDQYELNEILNTLLIKYKSALGEID